MASVDDAFNQVDDHTRQALMQMLSVYSHAAPPPLQPPPPAGEHCSSHGAHLGYARTPQPLTPEQAQLHAAPERVPTPGRRVSRAGGLRGPAPPPQPPPMPPPPDAYMQHAPPGLLRMPPPQTPVLYSPDLSPPPSQHSFGGGRDGGGSFGGSLTPLTPRTPSGAGRTPRSARRRHTPPPLRSPTPHDLGNSPYHPHSHHALPHTHGLSHSDRLPSMHSDVAARAQNVSKPFTLNSLPEDSEDRASSAPLPHGAGTGVFIPTLFRPNSTSGGGSRVPRTPPSRGGGGRGGMSGGDSGNSGLISDGWEPGLEHVSSVSADLPRVRSTFTVLSQCVHLDCAVAERADKGFASIVRSHIDAALLCKRAGALVSAFTSFTVLLRICRRTRGSSLLAEALAATATTPTRPSAPAARPTRLAAPTRSPARCQACPSSSAAAPTPMRPPPTTLTTPAASPPRAACLARSCWG